MAYLLISLLINLASASKDFNFNPYLEFVEKNNTANNYQELLSIYKEQIPQEHFDFLKTKLKNLKKPNSIILNSPFDLELKEGGESTSLKILNSSRQEVIFLFKYKKITYHRNQKLDNLWKQLNTLKSTASLDDILINKAHAALPVLYLLGSVAFAGAVITYNYAREESRKLNESCRDNLPRSNAICQKMTSLLTSEVTPDKKYGINEFIDFSVKFQKMCSSSKYKAEAILLNSCVQKLKAQIDIIKITDPEGVHAEQ